MKRIFTSICILLIAAISTSAQKKNLKSLENQIYQMKIREVAMQHQLDSLCAVNESNNVIVSQLEIVIDGLNSLIGQTNGTLKYEVKGRLNNGLALVKQGLYFGYVNGQGDLVIPAQYEDAHDFHKGLARVKINDKWGFIDTSGRFVIEPKFDSVSVFGMISSRPDHARVEINGNVKFIDKTGAFVN
jgi:hypothetical protein